MDNAGMPESAETLDSPSDLSPATRRGPITREDLINAALQLVGPHRSLSTLSLREVARAAGIAPNSFYRHFRDTDELAVAIIEQAGDALRRVIREARQRISSQRSVILTSMEVFIEQLDAEDKLMQVFLREGSAGSDAFKQTVEQQLQFFEAELGEDLIRIQAALGNTLFEPQLTAKAITRLVFAMGSTALDTPVENRQQLIDDSVKMIRMLIAGAQTLADES